MKVSKAKIGVISLVILIIYIGFTALWSLLKPISNGCIMTYMYPTYIPISTPQNISSDNYNYALYLYREGWQKIDFNDYIKQLSGVPVLFIPGNGGSHKQVRSMGTESDRAFQAGPLKETFYQQASQISLPEQYNHKLDWFTVDLQGEHSAMDRRILEEHTKYVVYAIHRILDLYKESNEARVKEGAISNKKLPKSVILVGHSMGGFVARAVLMDPHLRKSSVETILTLSTPHQSPPLALQPSLGQYYAYINQEWKKGYEIQTSNTLSHVIVVSISGGYNDYQVRTKLESLEGIVPSTHGFMINTKGVKNVWLSMEHQAILWCNQLVVQVSHTLLSLTDNETGQPFQDVQKRLPIFTKMLQSAIPNNFYSKQSQFSLKNSESDSENRGYYKSSCPSNINWSEDGLEKDLYIQTTTVTVLAMDGRRRWLDIQKLGSNGRNYFMFVTNLAPCTGVRLHLWAQKENSTLKSVYKNALDVTSKMMQIPSGPAPRQVEPGRQSEQASPSSVFWLDLNKIHGFRFLTISVAPRPTVSGRPPPGISMGVGQFYNFQQGQKDLSPISLLMSMYSHKDMILEEDHPIALNLSFSISLGIIPVSISIETTGCGIRKSEFSDDNSDITDFNGLCKLRCFPPVALAWDATSGLHIFPNLFSETVLVDSSPALWNSIQSSQKTTLLLLVDPHCSYKTSIKSSISTTSGRFILLYNSQIMGLCVTVVFFALMRQAHAWEIDHPIPSLLSAVESNLRMPFPFIFLAVGPVLFALFFSCINSQPIHGVTSFGFVSIFCYLLANGIMIIIIGFSHLVFHVAARIHFFIKKRWQAWEGSLFFQFINWFVKLFSSLLSFKVIRILRNNPLLVTIPVTTALICFVQPALGLFVLLFSHIISCHNALTSSFMASFNNHTRKLESENDTNSLPYSDTQLEIFHHRHGLLILHLLAALSFIPSLVSWFQRKSTAPQSFPLLLDSILCLGVMLDGICDPRPEFNFFLLPGPRKWEIKLSSGYLIAGYFCYFSGMALAPYMAFYAMAIIGVICFASRIVQRRNRVKGEIYCTSRKHSHRL